MCTHCFQVMEMLQQALHTLPDTSDLDSKLIVPMEAFESMETSDPNFNEMDTNAILDKMMCDIVDQI